jgi:hypothetical protein
MSTTSRNPREFAELVETTGQQLRRNALISGAALVEIATVGWLIGAVAIDMLLPLPVFLRVVVWIGFWVVLLGSAAAMVLFPRLRTLRIEDVALRIERAVGGMHNRLLTVLDIHRQTGRHKDLNAEFVQRLLDQTQQKLTGFRIESVADPAPVRRSVYAVAGTVLLVIVMAVLFWERMPTALARVLAPTADIAPVTWLRIESAGDLEVLHGEPLAVTATIRRGEADELTLHLKQGGEPWTSYPMRRGDDGRFGFTLDSVTANYQYKISGGRTWTAVNRITVVPRPLIESVGESIYLPDYMRVTEPLIVPADAQRIEAPVGSTVQVAVKVSGDVKRGEVLLMKPVAASADQVREQETVWFEDDLPADAVTNASWRWTTTNVYSGLKAHTFNWDRRPYAFKTRLYPLHVPKDALLYAYTYIDPQDPPSQIVLTFHDAARVITAVWGTPLAEKRDDKKSSVQVGELPAAGKWVRLEVTAAQSQTAAAPLTLGGMSFEIDKGRVTFDRPGFLTRTSTKVDSIKLESLGSRPMSLDTKSAQWIGDIPVGSDVQFSVRFFNGLNHPSADRAAMPIVATKDNPPTIVIEKPGKDVVLAEAAPVPIAGKAFDDYGLASVSLAVGPSAEKLSLRPLISAEKPQTTRAILAVIDPKAEKLEPGQGLVYKVVAKDYKGQVVETPLYKLAIAAPAQANGADVTKGPPPLDGLLKGLGDLLKAPLNLADAAADLLSGLPKGFHQDSKGRIIKPDGTVLSDAETKKLMEDLYAKLTAEQRKKLAEVNALLDKREKELEALSAQLKQAAEDSAKSALTSQQEAALARQMAAEAADLAAQLKAQTAAQGDPAALERLMRTQQAAQDEPQDLAALEEQMKQLEAARKAMASDPALAQQMLDDALADAQAQAAMQQLANLDQDLAEQQRELADLARQQQELGDETDKANAKKLAQISKEQRALDKKSQEEIDETRRLLGLKPDREDDPLAPWNPPGREAEAMPVEEDVADPNKKKPEKTAADAAAEKEKEAEEENWWDKPVDLEHGGFKEKMSERFKDRQRPVDPADQDPANGKKSPPTPREALREHQDEFHQELTQNADEVASQRQSLSEMQSQMKSARSQGKSGQKSQSQPSPSQAMKAMMASEAMQRAMAMAGRAQQPGQGQGKPKPGQPGGQPPSKAQAGIGQIVDQEPGLLNTDPKDRAALYKLPPNIRQPLLQGMQEKGPEGYQPLIDAYYRELSKGAQ